MKLDDDFKNDVKNEFKEGDYIATRMIIRAILIIFILASLCGVCGIIYTKTIGKTQKNAEREVFKESVAYNEQASSFLAKEYKEYNDAETKQDKNTVMNYVVIRYPNLDTDSIENATLRQFYVKCLNN